MAEPAEGKSRVLCGDRPKIRLQVNWEISGQKKHKRAVDTDPAMADMACISVLCKQVPHME